MWCKIKFIAWLVIAMMLFSISPGLATAADNQPGTSLNQAIQTVKQNFTVPTNYADFTSGYNSSDLRQSWSLNWSDSDKGGNFAAEVDAATGEIISMNFWQPTDGSSPSIPAISITEARSIGTRLLNRLIPQRISSLRLVEDNQIIPLTSYSQTYRMQWERLANNVPVAGDGASVEINLNNGQITGYNLNWTNMEIPSSANAITSEQAQQVFIKSGMLNLQYVLPSEVKPLTDNQKQSPLLVYSITHKSNGIIDAIKGVPLEIEPGQWLQNGPRMYNDLAVGGMGESKSSTSLTPQEEKEIDQTSNLISQEDAAAVVEKYVGIPAGLKLQNANLGKDWGDGVVRTWNLNWNSDSSDRSAYKNLYARVNALTGELTGFNLDLLRTDSSKTSLTRTEARQIAENFINKVQPEKCSQVKLADSYYTGSDQYNWDFNYQRVVNGIICADNSMDITVDKVNQCVVSFYLHWTDQKFPEAVNILSTDKANQTFLQGLPLILTYTPLYGNQGPQEMKLVYMPQSPSNQPAAAMIDAHTGDWLGADGTPVDEQIKSYKFNDIAGHFAETEIALLGQAGLFGEYGNAFHPDENITLVSLLRAMLGIRDGIYSSRGLADQEVMNRANVLGWVKNDQSPSAPVNREMTAQLITRYLDLEYLTKIPQLFQITFQDSTAMSPELKGCAALTWGLGIIKGDGVNFGPAQTVTRAEAAAYLVRTLKVKN